MPWQNNGDYYYFKEEEIKVHAPTASGVYGLYNVRHQITIGNSANICEALLRHLRDSNFRFRRFEPTGFTFEVCPKDSSDVRMQQLIFEYNPIIQSRGRIGLRSLWRSWMTPSAGAFHSQVTLTSEEYHQKHVPGETKAAAIKPFISARFNRDKFLLAGVICSVFLLAVTLFAVLPDLQSSARMVLWHISSVMHQTISAEEQARVRSLKSTREIEIVGERSTVDNGPTGLENDRDRQQQIEKEIDQFAAESSAPAALTPPENSVSDTIKAASVGIEEPEKRAQLPSLEKTGKHWAVQVVATPDRGVATVSMKKLNAKGYDAFVVEAEIDGKTWYRVRLGNFKTRRDAETLGALVRLKEGFHDAFVADSTKSEIVALERP
jgi:cell division septation protein DedD